jgi:hypothetical protein
VILAVHSMFEVFDHVSGRPEPVAEGLESGPRNPGHSGSAAKAHTIETHRTTTLLMILLDYRSE